VITLAKVTDADLAPTPGSPRSADPAGRPAPLVLVPKPPALRA
jgi:hypothetical protein